VDLYLHSPRTPSWRGAQLKHKDKFTFTFYILHFTLTDRNEAQGEIRRKIMKMLVNIHTEYYYYPVLLLNVINMMVCETIVFPIIFYGCENWSLTLREIQNLQMCGSKRSGKYLDLRMTKRVNKLGCYMKKNSVILLGE
jgi:hypothetical protein